MKKALKKAENIIYYYKGSDRIEGAPPEVSGNLTGISGDLTGIRGDLDDCEISDEDRKKGIDISELVEE